LTSEKKGRNVAGALSLWTCVNAAVLSGFSVIFYFH